MTKSQMVKEIARKSGFTQKDVSEVVEVLLETIAETLANKEDVRFMGFGNFITKDKEVAQRRNPRTGEMVTVPAHTIVKFKPAKALHDQVLNEVAE